MYLSLPVFLLLVFSLVSLAGSLIAFAGSFLHLHNRVKLDQDNANLLKKAQEAKHIVDLANKKAFQIVADANLTAQELVANAQSISVESKKLMDREFKDLMQTQSADIQIAGQKLLSFYETKMEEVKNNNLNLFKNISKDIEANALTEVEDFKKLMAQETVDSQKIVNEKIETIYKETANDIETYKANKIKELDDTLTRIIQDVVKGTIGSSLTLKDHHQLLLKALKEARLEEGILDS